MVNSMGDMKSEAAPLVSISVLAYNHEKYIRQCLDSILLQEVNFPYEILIHDDASPDGTVDIIREYEAKYPEIIKPIYQTENQYSQRKFVDTFNVDRARGKYLAFCDGDDYWLDPKKLQKQVNFLEKHSEYIATAHRVRAIDEHGELLDIPGFTDAIEHVFTIDDYLKRMFQTFSMPSQISSFVMRNVFLTLDPRILSLFYSCKANSDEKLTLLLIMMGEAIYTFSEDMSAYRRVVSEGTSWNAQTHGKNISHLIYKQRLALQEFADEAFGFELPESILYNILLCALMEAVCNPSLMNLRIFLDIVQDMPNKHSMIAYHLARIPRYAKRIAATTRQTS